MAESVAIDQPDATTAMGALRRRPDPGSTQSFRSLSAACAVPTTALRPEPCCTPFTDRIRLTGELRPTG